VQAQLKSLSNKSPRTLEEFLMENSCNIHDDHLLMVEVKYALCLMYGNVAGFRYEGRYEYENIFLMLHKLCCEGAWMNFDLL
jgi:hypothetical protein